MWVARFRLRDEEDIYSPLCLRYTLDFFAVPYSLFLRRRQIHTFIGGVLSGSVDRKQKFVQHLQKDKRVRSVEQYRDFLFVHAIHPLSRETRAEIEIFYHPQYIRVKPVHLSSDGWEYWEVACFDRAELVKLVMAAEKYYSGELFFIRKEKMRAIASLALAPDLTEKQFAALELAYKEGYYTYPHTLTMTALAGHVHKSYATFQEHLRKAEQKLVRHFLLYR